MTIYNKINCTPFNQLTLPSLAILFIKSKEAKVAIKRPSEIKTEISINNKYFFKLKTFCFK